MVQQNAECDASIMQKIDRAMREVNPYVVKYRLLHEVAKRAEEEAGDEMEPIQWELRLIRTSRDDKRRYNLPITNNECMYLIESADGDVPNIDLAVHPRGQSGCKRLHHLSRHIDPMVFPILFPCGDSGWSLDVPNAILGKIF